MKFYVRYHYRIKNDPVNCKAYGPSVFGDLKSVYKHFKNYLVDYDNWDNNPIYASIESMDNEFNNSNKENEIIHIPLFWGSEKKICL